MGIGKRNRSRKGGSRWKEVMGFFCLRKVIGMWIPAIPSWEKKFCKQSVRLSWKEFCEAKKYTTFFPEIEKWNDSAAEEAFHQAKRRYFAKINDIPCDSPEVDPDAYIDIIDWNSLDMGDIVDWEDEYAYGSKNEQNYDNGNQDEYASGSKNEQSYDNGNLDEYASGSKNEQSYDNRSQDEYASGSKNEQNYDNGSHGMENVPDLYQDRTILEKEKYEKRMEFNGRKGLLDMGISTFFKFFKYLQLLLKLNYFIIEKWICGKKCQ